MISLVLECNTPEEFVEHYAARRAMCPGTEPWDQLRDEVVQLYRERSVTVVINGPVNSSAINVGGQQVVALETHEKWSASGRK